MSANRASLVFKLMHNEMLKTSGNNVRQTVRLKKKITLKIINLDTDLQDTFLLTELVRAPILYLPGITVLSSKK